MRSMHTGKNQSLRSMRSVYQQTGSTWLRATSSYSIDSERFPDTNAQHGLNKSVLSSFT